MVVAKNRYVRCIQKGYALNYKCVKTWIFGLTSLLESCCVMAANFSAESLWQSDLSNRICADCFGPVKHLVAKHVTMSCVSV